MKETTVCLSDLCDLIAESVAPGERPDDLYLGLEHVASRRLMRTGGGQASEMRSSTSRFKRGDVLYGKLRPYLDKAVLADEGGVCTTELLVLRVKGGVEPRFLAVLLHSLNFIKHAVAGTTGVQHPRTSWAHIREFKVPGFTQEEQSRIADLLWFVHKAIAQSEALIEVAQSLKRAAMRTLFTHGLRGEAQKETEVGPVPEGWKLTSFGVLFNIVQGFSLKKNLSEDGKGVPFLRTSNIYWGRTELNSVSRMRIDPASIGDRVLEAGDLLVCEGGEIGRATVWDGEIENCTFQNHIHRLRPQDDGRVTPRFAMSWLEEGFCHRRIYEGAGNRTTIPNLSQARLGELTMPLPSLDEQREIVAILDSIDRKIDLHRKKRAVLDNFFKVLLHKLMTEDIRVGALNFSALQSNHNSLLKPRGTNVR